MFDAGSKWGHIPQYLGAFRQHAEAKGSSWLDAYAREEQWMRDNYPQYNADNLKHKFGLNIYKATQILSGRHLMAMADTRKFRGKTLAQVFGSPAR